MAGYKGSFDEIEKLGSGAFGKVYKARHSLDGQEYAVKKIRLRQGLKEDKLKQVLREVTTLARLYHPNVVRYHYAWKEEDAGDDSPESSVPGSTESSESRSAESKAEEAGSAELKSEDLTFEALVP
ncbi:hypothetical protein BaRGS_00017351, partial [Batillaria attramentaria]